ncbi:MAG: cytochrome P450 [Bacteroidetes bacterium]|nr:cytochrome P450 [Bacteroidota bacterium]
MAIWTGPDVRPSIADLVRFRREPHAFLLDLARRHGPTFRYGSGSLGFTFGSAPEHVQHVLVDHQKHFTKDTFQYRFLSEVTGTGLLTADGQTWRERRRIQQPAFGRSRLHHVVDSTNRSVDLMLERWQQTNVSQVNIADEMFRISLDIVMDVLFGVRIADDAPRIVEATLGVLHHLIDRSRSIPGLPSWVHPAKHLAYRRSLAVLDGLITDVVSRWEPQDGEDDGTLLDLLLRAQSDGRITAEGVRNEMMTMVIAGHETVASALTWAWRLLGDHPIVAEELAKEAAADQQARRTLSGVSTLRVARNVISEAMRLYPPAWIVTRKCVESYDDPSGLAKGTLVMLSPYVTHRLDQYWPEPERFDPSRFDAPVAPGTWYPFGAGQRLCIGRDFALVEAAIILSAVASTYRLRPVHARSQEYAGVTLQPEGGVVVSLERRPGPNVGP